MHSTPFSLEQLLSYIPAGIIDWIPNQRFLGISPSNPHFLSLVIALAALIALGLFTSWCRLVARPLIFAVVYSAPFFLFGFENFLGDSQQWVESINGRYYMSEPGSTMIHYWFNAALGQRFNLSPFAALTITSRLAGFFFLWITACLSKAILGDSTPRKHFIFRMVYFTAGVSLLFYGYAENTPLALPAEQLWILTIVWLFRAPSSSAVLTSAAAFTLAFFIHGRIGFTAPAFALALIIPPGTALQRLRRLALGGCASLALLTFAIGYIFLFERKYVLGNPFGNATGGGNRQMFASATQLTTWRHWREIISAAFFGVGLFAPIGVTLAIARSIRKPELILTWLLGYALCSIVYLGFWEFDFGPFLDWDLIFSGALPFILMAALSIRNLGRGTAWTIPLLVICSATTLFIGMIINGAPFSLNLTKVASPPETSQVCSSSGLLRTYFSDTALINPLGDNQPALPKHEWGTPIEPIPNNPFGVRYRGYVKITTPGRYRVSLVGTGNVRLIIGNQTLYERWSGFEWRVGAERQLRFPVAGWYPILIEMSTQIHSVPLNLSITSNNVEIQPLKMEDLCHSE